jgi:hypothetical protein
VSDRALIVAALVIGGAVVAASLQGRTRYALSAADSTTVWRMDTWSGQIDVCAAAYVPNGPLVRCGAVIVTREPDAARPDDAPGLLPKDQKGTLRGDQL